MVSYYTCRRAFHYYCIVNRNIGKDMKTFKQYLSEEGPKGDGDCFHVAGRAMIDMTDEQEVYGMKLVHAFVYGQGPLKGRRFEHAWNEQGSTCLDNSNGQKTVMNKKQYYKLAGVVKERGAYATYDQKICGTIHSDTGGTTKSFINALWSSFSNKPSSQPVIAWSGSTSTTSQVTLPASTCALISPRPPL